MKIVTLTGSKDIEPFFKLVKGEKDYNYSYEHFELLDFLDALSLLPNLVEYLDIRYNQNWNEIEKLNSDIQYQIYLRIPYALVPSDVANFDFIKEWIQVNKDNLDFGNYYYLLNNDSIKQYYNGKQEGKQYCWYPNGNKWHEENYVNDLKEGVQYIWHENGELRYKYNYMNGNMQGKQYGWYENGSKWYQFNCLNGKREGKEYEWYKNGKLLHEGNYVNGLKEGVQYTWYENGQLGYKHNYMNGKRKGKQYAWHENGNKWYEENYINGRKTVK